MKKLPSKLGYFPCPDFSKLQIQFGNLAIQPSLYVSRIKPIPIGWAHYARQMGFSPPDLKMLRRA